MKIRNLQNLLQKLEMKIDAIAKVVDITAKFDYSFSAFSYVYFGGI